MVNAGGGNRSLAASAKMPCQTGKSGHSSLNNRNANAPPRTKVGNAQLVYFAKLLELPLLVCFRGLELSLGCKA
jgi:hypothetical protein